MEFICFLFKVREIEFPNNKNSLHFVTNSRKTLLLRYRLAHHFLERLPVFLCERYLSHSIPCHRYICEKVSQNWINQFSTTYDSWIRKRIVVLSFALLYRIVPTMTFLTQSIYPSILRHHYLQKDLISIYHLCVSHCVLYKCSSDRANHSKYWINTSVILFMGNRSWHSSQSYHQNFASISKQSQEKVKHQKIRQLSDIHTKNHLAMTIAKNGRKLSVIPFTTFSNGVPYAHDDSRESLSLENCEKLINAYKNIQQSKQSLQKTFDNQSWLYTTQLITSVTHLCLSAWKRLWIFAIRNRRHLLTWFAEKWENICSIVWNDVLLAQSSTKPTKMGCRW